MTNTYTNRCLLEKLTGKSAKQGQFGSTTTSWHRLKQAAGFLSLDLKCPHKAKGTTQSAIVKCQLWNLKYMK